MGVFLWWSGAAERPTRPSTRALPTVVKVEVELKASGLVVALGNLVLREVHGLAVYFLRLDMGVGGKVVAGVRGVKGVRPRLVNDKRRARPGRIT